MNAHIHKHDFPLFFILIQALLSSFFSSVVYYVFFFSISNRLLLSLIHGFFEISKQIKTKQKNSGKILQLIHLMSFV
jgi:hypothetical protein